MADLQNVLSTIFRIIYPFICSYSIKVEIGVKMRKIKNLTIQCSITGAILKRFRYQIYKSQTMMHIPCNMDLYNGNEINILKRVVRLFFDLLHGIKCMDVPLVMVLEFSIFLGYDRQLEMDSYLERELLTSVI